MPVLGVVWSAGIQAGIIEPGRLTDACGLAAGSGILRKVRIHVKKGRVRHRFANGAQ